MYSVSNHQSENHKYLNVYFFSLPTFKTVVQLSATVIKTLTQTRYAYFRLSIREKNLKIVQQQTMMVYYGVPQKCLLMDHTYPVNGEFAGTNVQGKVLNTKLYMVPASISSNKQMMV